MGVNRRGFLKSILAGAVAGPAALEALAQVVPPERMFTYFNGEIEVSLSVKKVLEQFSALSEKLVAMTRLGQGSNWLNIQGIVDCFREIFPAKWKWDSRRDSREKRFWKENWEKYGEGVVWFPADYDFSAHYWIGENCPIYFDVSDVGLTDTELLGIVENFFDMCEDELVKMPAEALAKFNENIRRIGAGHPCRVSLEPEYE